MHTWRQQIFLVMRQQIVQKVLCCSWLVRRKIRIRMSIASYELPLGNGLLDLCYRCMRSGRGYLLRVNRKSMASSCCACFHPGMFK